MLARIDGEVYAYRGFRYYFTEMGVSFMGEFERLSGDVGMANVLISASSEMIRLMVEGKPGDPVADDFIAKNLVANNKWDGPLIASKEEERVCSYTFELPWLFVHNFRLAKQGNDYKNTQEAFEHMLRFSYCLAVLMRSSPAEARGIIQ